MSNEALRLFLAYNESEQEYESILRMEYEWNDVAYLNMISLLKNVLEEYKESLVIPKSLVYYISKVLKRIVDIVSNDLFGIVPPPYFTKQAYHTLIDKRVKEMLQLREYFFTEYL
jgi:hypothetical protein